MIFLHKPYIEKNGKKSRLVFNVDINKEKKHVFFEVEKKYEKYLCCDRIDAILVGILSYAMRKNECIKSDSYVTEELLYKIKTYLIPTITKYDDFLFPIDIDIKTIKTCKNAGKVGVGMSCGIDSLHAYYSHNAKDDSQFNLTHLCINNVGAFNATYSERGIDIVRKERYIKAEEFAKEVGLPIIITDSNLDDEIEQVHSYTHTYSSCFAILCLQKLWGIYYYGSSGYDFTSFNVKETSSKDPSCYELLSLDCFSTNCLKIYSDGAEKTRLEKTEFIYQKDLTKKYLHVCLKKEYNCGKCDKCKRTLLTLEALNTNLYDYSEIFDIDYYIKHKEEYYDWILKEHLWSDKSINEPTYQKLLSKKDFSKYVKEHSNNHNNTNDKNVGDGIDYQLEYEKVLNSKTYKVGKIIMYIPRTIKNFLKK